MTAKKPAPRAPYQSTGVFNRAWLEATKVVGRQYTPREIEQGWPLGIEPHRLACLQHPQDPAGQNYVSVALLAACKKKAISCIPFEHHDYTLSRDGKPELIGIWMDYAIGAHDFSNWLTTQGEKPSAHIAAWFEAAGVATATLEPHPTKLKTKEQRQARRYQMCIDAGLKMPTSEYAPLPRGIGKIAKMEGIKTPSFAQDVKAYIARLNTV